MSQDSNQLSQNNSGDTRAFQTQAQGSTLNQAAGNIINNYAPNQPALGKPFQYQPLPSPYVDRPVLRAQIKAKLLDTQPATPGTLVMSAIYGLGGIGKSVMASALVFDREVQEAFPDGILWATLGQNPDLLPRLSEWIQAMGDYDYKPTSLDAASMHLRTLLIEKRMLLVVDDVWNPEHVLPFRVGSGSCRVLVTTRKARIPDADRVDMDVMTDEQSLELLLDKAKCKAPLPAERQAAEALVQELGKLPLALELAGAQIADGLLWEELLEDLRAEVARLESLDSPDFDEATQEQSRKRLSLVASFNLSLKQLSETQLNQFIWLGVLPEDVTVNQEMISTLWQVTPREAGRLLQGFWNKALVLRGVEQVGRRASYRMHDLMHDVARRLIEAPVIPANAEEVAGWGMTLPEAHEQLLQHYREQLVEGQWHTLRDDGYIFAQLTWHMEQARQPQAIHGLLRASNGAGRNGWYEACDALGKPAGFVNDLGRAWRLAVESYEAAPGEAMVLLWRYALIRGSLNSMASNVPAELVGALVEKGVWSAAQGLAYAQQAQDPWHRAECISAIVPYMPEALLDEVLKTVNQIRDAAYRSYVLGKLAERFPQLWPEVVSCVDQIQDRYGDLRQSTKGFSHRGLALARLAHHLPLEYVVEAVAIARKIKDVGDRRIALVAFAKIDAQQLPEALKLIQELKDERERAYAFVELSNQLPSEQLPEALKLIREFKDERERAYTLVELSNQFPELLPEALEIAREFRDEWQRAHTLIELSNQFPELLPEALEIAREFKDAWQRANALIKLSNQFPELLLEALEIAREFKYEWQRASVLLEISRYLLSPEQLPEVLKLIRELRDEGQCASALVELSRQFPELLPEALERARELKGEKEERAFALIELSEQLPELLPEALELIQELQDEWQRANVLIEISKRLPLELFSEALELVRKLKNERQRAHALIELSRRLPLELFSEALELIRELRDEWQRASNLIELSKRFPELLPEALEIARKLTDKDGRASALIELFTQFPELLPEALKIVRELKDEGQRAYAWVELSKQLPELLSEALKIVRELKDEGQRTSALIELSKNLPPELLPKALKIVQELKDERQRVSALIELSKNLPPKLLPKALKIARELTNPIQRVFALIELSKHLSELWLEALESIQELNEWQRTSAIIEISQHLLSPELLPFILKLIRELQDEWQRASNLIELSKQFPELLPEALECARELKDEEDRASALIELSKPFPELLPEALELIRKLLRELEDEEERASALIELSKQFPELLPEALELIRKLLRELEDEEERASNLIELSQQFPELLPEALKPVRELKDEGERASVLSELSKQLPPDLLAEALKIACSIKDESSRASVLSDMATSLPANLREKGLKSAINIQDSYFRATALQGYLPYLEQLQTSFPAWSNILETLAYQNRSELLSALPHIRVLILSLSNETTFSETLQTTRDICKQWP